MRRDPCSVRVPDGQYRAMYVDCESGSPYGGPRLFAWFKITEPGEFMGLEIPRFYNTPRRPFLPRTHNLWKDYVALIQSRPPTRGLTLDHFLKGCEVLVATATVKRQSEGGRWIELPEDCWYSKIDRLIRITAGSPPCIRRM